MAERNVPRVVITGVGVVSPIGNDLETVWDHLVAGRTGIDFLKSFPTERLPSKFGAEVRDFDPAKEVYQKKFLKAMSRDIQLGVVAASKSMRNSGIERGQVDPLRMGVDFGASHISTTPQELVEAVRGVTNAEQIEGFTRWGEDRMGKICPLWMLRQLPNMPACHIAIEHDAQGPNNTITCRESSGLLALAEGVRTIERGVADVMIVGACSSMMDPIDITRMNSFETLSQRDDDPQRACRPFDKDRDGAVVGEGAGAFVLEEYNHAVRRGANIYAEVIGVGAGSDGFKNQSTSTGTGLVRAIQAALTRAGVRPDEIGHINAHGKSTVQDDFVESRAFHRALGSAADRIPVTAITSYVGHFDAGTGAVELAASVLGLQHGELPMTLNYETPDPNCPINVVKFQPQPLRNSLALSVNRTKLGQSAACLIRAL